MKLVKTYVMVAAMAALICLVTPSVFGRSFGGGGGGGHGYGGGGMSFAPSSGGHSYSGGGHVYGGGSSFGGHSFAAPSHSLAPQHMNSGSGHMYSPAFGGSNGSAHRYVRSPSSSPFSGRQGNGSMSEPRVFTPGSGGNVWSGSPKNGGEHHGSNSQVFGPGRNSGNEGNHNVFGNVAERKGFGEGNHEFGARDFRDGEHNGFAGRVEGHMFGSHDHDHFFDRDHDHDFDHFGFFRHHDFDDFFFFGVPVFFGFPTFAPCGFFGTSPFFFNGFATAPGGCFFDGFNWQCPPVSFGFSPVVGINPVADTCFFDGANWACPASLTDVGISPLVVTDQSFGVTDESCPIVTTSCPVDLGSGLAFGVGM